MTKPIKPRSGATEPPRETPCSKHTKNQPDGYPQWHAWAEKMGKTHEQIRCPDCGLWKIWIPKSPAPTAEPRQHAARYIGDSEAERVANLLNEAGTPETPVLKPWERDTRELWEKRSPQLDAAWKEYLKSYPYSVTAGTDPWIAFKWAWDAAMKISQEAIDDN